MGVKERPFCRFWIGSTVVDFEPEDNVWVKTANWSTDRPSKKLSEQIAGLYKVIAKKGHSYKVKLPALIKIHLVFSIKSLCRDLNDLLLC